ncbi:MAG: hypothetical protein OXG44_06035 [Gammaproteobacteria bacterium]|nr:hypothetical protein [Gammaproteobacteria bacterium]
MRAYDFTEVRNGVRITRVPRPVRKVDIVAEPEAGTAAVALKWMRRHGVEATDVFHLLRRFPGRALRRRHPDGLVYLCGAQFEDGTSLTWRLKDA